MAFPMSIGSAIELADRLILGEDFFISYSRQDGMKIAQDLEARLSVKFAVYVDLYGSPPSETVPAQVLRRVHRASMLVLLATPAAVASTAVATEVAAFRSTGRTLIPVSFGGALEGSALHLNTLRGLAISPEQQSAEYVSKETESRIVAAFSYAKRATRIASVLLGTFAVAGVVSGAGYYISERDRRIEAERRACVERLESERSSRALYDAMLNLPPSDSPTAPLDVSSCEK